MELTLSKDLSFINENGIVTIPSKQYDTARIFEFNLIQDDSELDIDFSACTVYLRILKADGTQFQGEECCYMSKNEFDEDVVVVDTSKGNGNQILSAPGLNKCEIHFSDTINHTQLTTWDFYILVKERVHNGDNINSQDSWDGLDEMRKASERLDTFINTFEIYSITSPNSNVQSNNQYWIKKY